MMPARALVASIALLACGCAQREPNPAVWVNTSSGVYHCAGSQYFQSTAQGQLARESEARAQGYRPADDAPCGDPSAPVQPDTAAPGTPQLPLYAGPNVWVNISSGIYHCPGSRYYRSTGSGELMAESDAKAAGHRPAGGRDCR